MDFFNEKYTGTTETGGSVNFSLISLAPTFFLHFPLFVDEKYPNGKIQPYIGAAVIIHYGDINADYVEVSEKVSLSGGGVGARALGGIMWQTSGNVLFFVEYGLMLTNIDASNNSMFIEESVSGSILSNQFLIGVAFPIKTGQ